MKTTGLGESWDRIHAFLTRARELALRNGLSWSDASTDGSNVFVDISQIDHRVVRRAGTHPSDGPPSTSKTTIPRARLVIRHDATSTHDRPLFAMALSTPPDQFGATAPLVRLDGRPMVMVSIDVYDAASTSNALDRFEEAFEQLSIVRLSATRADLAEIVAAVKGCMDDVHDRDPEPSFEDCMRHYARFEPLLRLVADVDPTLARRELLPALEHFREQAGTASPRGSPRNHGPSV